MLHIAHIGDPADQRNNHQRHRNQAQHTDKHRTPWFDPVRDHLLRTGTHGNKTDQDSDRHSDQNRNI